MIEAVYAVASVFGTGIVVFILLLIFFHFKQDWIFYKPKRSSKKRTNTVIPGQDIMDGAVLFEDNASEITVTVKPEQIKTSDDLTLRGFSLEYNGSRKPD